MDQFARLGDTISKPSTYLVQDRDRTKVVDREFNSDHSGLLCKGSRSSRGKCPTGEWGREGCGQRGEKGRWIRVRLHGFNYPMLFLCPFMARVISYIVKSQTYFKVHISQSSYLILYLEKLGVKERKSLDSRQWHC